jgi:hypothetical protein
MRFSDALVEKQGVPEHPKKAAQKKDKTLKSEFGSETIEKVKDTAEKLKGKESIDNPRALAMWMHTKGTQAKKARKE